MTQMAKFRANDIHMYLQWAIIPVQAYTDVYWQWEQYQVSTANSEPTIGTISPVVNLRVCKKAL